MKFYELLNRVIDCAIEIHREAGPGLPGATYQQCRAHERTRKGLRFKPQHPQPVEYKDLRLA